VKAEGLLRRAAKAEGLLSSELMRFIAGKKIKITPEIMITGGEGGQSEPVQAVLARLLKSDVHLPGQSRSGQQV
jgi:hypothetical protein